MKGLLLTTFLFLSYISFSQVCADEDTVRSNAVSLITYNSCRINGTTSHFTASPTSLQLRYVRVGFTDTATVSSVPSTALRNLTGLAASTQYYYYYKTICGSGNALQTIGAYTFTTTSNSVLYAAERPTVFNYVKSDSSFKVPRADTSYYRAPNTSGGDLVFKTSDNKFYGYNGSYWIWLGVDSSGIMPAVNLKVDSVTVAGDSLFYWIQGVSHGYIFPPTASVDSITRTPGIDSIYFWRSGTQYAVKDSIGGSGWSLSGNASTSPGTNFIGTTDAQGLMFKVNGVQSGYISPSETNTIFGYNSLIANTTGTGNTIIGYNCIISITY